MSTDAEHNPWPETDEERVAFEDWKREVSESNTAASFRDWLTSQSEAEGASAPTPVIYILFTDDSVATTFTSHHTQEAALLCLRENFAQDDNVDDNDLLAHVASQGVVAAIGRVSI